MQDGLFKSILAHGLLHDPWHLVTPSPKFLMLLPVFALTSHLNSYVETSISHLAGGWFIHFTSKTTLHMRPQASSLILSAHLWFPVFSSHSAYSFSIFIFCTRRCLSTDKQQADNSLWLHLFSWQRIHHSSSHHQLQEDARTSLSPVNLKFCREYKGTRSHDSSLPSKQLESGVTGFAGRSTITWADRSEWRVSADNWTLLLVPEQAMGLGIFKWAVRAQLLSTLIGLLQVLLKYYLPQ